MSESSSVLAVDRPNTKTSLTEEFRQLGLEPGMNLIVHSSLSSLGWVSGGAVAVIGALMDVLTPESTLILPTHSPGYTEPSLWMNPAVPEHWWEVIRETMPAFDPQFTPSSFMGVISESFRSFPKVLRSAHPAVSFAAWGKHAAFITENHSLDYSMGEGSPLAKLYQLDGHVLLIGVGHDSNSSLHLAEARFPAMPTKTEGAPILIDRERSWVTYTDIEYDTSDFTEIGLAFEATHPVNSGKVGAAHSCLLPQPALVDFAVGWMQQHRLFPGDSPQKF